MHCGITAVHTKEIFDYTLDIIEDIFIQMVREGY